jgi:ABC-type polysaccharide/polyol phosphate export permease
VNTVLGRLRADIKEMLHEQVEFRELLYQMTMRDLRLRYKQTVMGFGWAVFMPLLNTAVFSVIFMKVAPLDTGMPYPLFAFVGLLFWNFFSASLKFAMNSLSSNSNLVTKVYFPREVFPFSAVIVSFVDTLPGAVVLIGMMAWYGAVPTSTIVLLPVVMAVQLAFTVAISLLLAMGNLFYRDVKYLFEVGLQVWMFATSVVYPADKIGGTLGAVMRLNPMTPIIDGYRQVLVLGQAPGVPFAIVGVLSFALLLFAWVHFHRSEFEFAENV